MMENYQVADADTPLPTLVGPGNFCVAIRNPAIAEAIADELNRLAAEVERLREENVRLRDATRPRRLTDELPPEDMHEALFWDGVRWEVFDNWEGDSWMAEWINGRLMSHTHWLSLPEPPKEGIS